MQKINRTFRKVNKSGTKKHKFEKQKFVHWSENAKLKLKFVNVFPTSSHPDKAYLGTPKVYFKNRFYKHIRLNNPN